MGRFSIFFAVLLASISVHAKMELISITGASRTSAIYADALTIYGGIAGKDCSQEAAPGETCNNCQGDLKACNENRIYPDLKMTFTVSSDVAAGAVKAYIRNQPLNVVVLSKGINIGETSTAQILWADICDLAFKTSENSAVNFIANSSANSPANSLVESNRDCSRDIKAPIVITIDQNGSDALPLNIAVAGNNTADFHSDCTSSDTLYGICQYRLFSNDSLLELGYVVSEISFPASPGSFFEFAHLFYSNEGFDKIQLTSEHLVSKIEFSEDGSLIFTPREFPGLEVGRLYHFRLGLEDVAGNFGFFTPLEASDPARHAIVIMP